MNLSGGILHFHSYYKIAEILEKQALANVKPTSEIEVYPNLIYIQWLTYFLNRKVEFSKNILEKNLNLISEMLIQDLREYSKEYQKGKLTVIYKKNKTENAFQCKTARRV